MRDMLSIAMADEGYEVLTAADGEEALRALETEPADVVVSDIRMPGLDGLQLLQQVSATCPDTDVILITAHASTDTAIEALRLGAYDYVTKPFDVEELKITVRRAMERQVLRRENVLLRNQLEDRHRVGNLVGRSSAMKQVFELIHRVKDSTSTVLIIGESGTGKELVARAIHYSGNRREQPFVAVNCAALPPHLLESELFGHVKGAFTGADRHKEGLFEAADGGTILLDEIGDMPLEMQPKLLRVLEDRKVRRVGATRDSEIDVRVLAATNQDLRAAFREGRFREDLFYRLNVIQIDLPPLRDRSDDVPLLCEHFLARLVDEADKPIQGFEPEAARLLQAYPWPGNVRELVNAVRHAVTMETGSMIGVESLPATIVGAVGSGSASPSSDGETEPPGETTALPEDFDLERHLDEIKRRYMVEALERAEGVQTHAAELLGMTFRSFRYYAKKFGLADDATE